MALCKSYPLVCRVSNDKVESRTVNLREGSKVKLCSTLRKGLKLRPVHQVTKGIYKRVDIIGLACEAAEVVKLATAEPFQPLGTHNLQKCHFDHAIISFDDLVPKECHGRDDPRYMGCVRQGSDT